MFPAPGPIVETMIQWKALAAVGDTKLASTIFLCLNLQELKRDQNPNLKLISPKEIAGKTKIYL